MVSINNVLMYLFDVVQFHIGHIHEMQNKFQNAQETYEAVAQSENVPNHVKSNVYKQLGM